MLAVLGSRCQYWFLGCSCQRVATAASALGQRLPAGTVLSTHLQAVLRSSIALQSPAMTGSALCT